MTEINGADIEAVDIITFGSPCQDLSVAGKRAGLKHSANGDDETTRSGLFMEAVRIIKEMRKATNGKYPKYAIWENVMGAFSSNSGEDFRVVLEELVKICEPEAPPIPSPGKTGWPYADCIVGDGWSLAYRVFDAQYWGVAQRRRRLYALLDLTGECAGKILFEREGLRGYFEKGRTPWQGAAGNPQGSTGADDPESGITQRSASDSNIASTLYAAYGTKRNGNSGAYNGENFVLEERKGDIPYTLKIRSGCEGGGKGALIQEDLSATLATNNDQYLFQPIAVATQQGGAEISENGICPTVTAAAGMSGNNQPWTVYGISSYDSNAMKSSNPHSGIYEAATSRTLDLNGGNPACNQGGIAIVEPVAFTQNQRDELRYLGGKAGSLQAEPGMNQQTFIIDNIGGQAEYGKESQVNGTLRSGALGAICYDARGNGDGVTVNTITGDHNNRITDYSSVVVYDGSNITNPINAANPQPGDPCHTLSTDSRNHLVYCVQGDTIDRPAVSYATDVGFFNTRQDVSPTMLARMYKDPHLISYEKEPEYIVRRLTPTECARLQGFPDRWGDIPQKENFTDEEYSFWLNVRNTHAAINGRSTKEHTKEQMLRWYNKLHSDSSEYKMWGNGIALPNALYVMQGIAEVNTHG